MIKRILEGLKMDNFLDPVVVLRNGHTDDSGIRRLFVFAPRNNFMMRMQKSPNSINFVQEIFNIPFYYTFSVKTAKGDKKYLHIEKDDTITITDLPTFFCDKELYDGELETEAMKKNYEKLYEQSSYSSQYGMFEKELVDTQELKNKIFAQKTTSTPQSNDNSQGGCYVATTVYGSYNCPEVWTLRRYRDDTLAKTWYGRAFIRTYYTISPMLVKWFGKTNWFKNLWRGKLNNMVKKLQDDGVESTPYEDKSWQ